MKNTKESNRLDQVAVKSLARVARNVAQDSIEARCWLFLHEPKKPKDLKQRMDKIKFGAE